MADEVTNINSTSSLVMHHLNGYEIMDEFARKWIQMWEDTYFEPIKFNSLSIKYNEVTFQSGTTVKAGDIFTITWDLSKVPYQEQTKLTLANNNFAFIQAETRKYTLDIKKLSTAPPTMLKIPFISHGAQFEVLAFGSTPTLVYQTSEGANIEPYDFKTNQWKNEAYATIQISADDFYAMSESEQTAFSSYISTDIPNDPNGLVATIISAKGQNTYSFKYIGTNQTWITSQTLGTLTVIDPQKTDNIITNTVLLIPGSSSSIVPGGSGGSGGDSGGDTSITYIDIMVIASPSNTIVPVDITTGELKDGARLLYTTTKSSNVFPEIRTTLSTFADENDEDDYIWVRLPIDSFYPNIQENMNIDSIIYLFNPVLPAPMTTVDRGWHVSENSFNSNPNNADNDADSINNMIFQIKG